MVLHQCSPSLSRGYCIGSHERFTDAPKLNPAGQAALRLQARIDELFAIDARFRELGSVDEARYAGRQREATPLLDALRAELKETAFGCQPSSATAKAANYPLRLRHKLTRFLEHPELKLSN